MSEWEKALKKYHGNMSIIKEIIEQFSPKKLVIKFTEWP